MTVDEKALVDQVGRLLAAGWRGNPHMSGDDRNFMTSSMRRRNDDKARDVVEFVRATLEAAKPAPEPSPSPAAVQGSGVEVKPLEWVSDRHEDFSYRSETAKTSIGRYEAFSFIAAGNPVAGWTSTLSAQEGKSVSLDAAKAAAQADYEARIRSALLPASGAVASGGVEATEVKRIKDWLLERNRDHLIAAQDRTRVMFRKDGDAEMFLDAAILLVHLARLSVSTPPEVDAGQ